MLSVEVLQAPVELDRMGDEWNSLLRSSPANCVFLTHGWLTTWWRCLSDRRSLNVVTVRENGRLLGILPLSSRPAELSRMMPRILEFMGSGVIGSDYLDVIVQRDREVEVLEAFAEYLSRQGAIVQFGQLRGGDNAAARLAARLEQRGWTVSTAAINVCPFIPLAGRSWDDYLKSLSSSHRYNFNRRLRHLEKNGFTVEVVSSPGEAQRGLDSVIALHRKRWSDRGMESEAFQSESIVQFHRDFVVHAAEQGWLRLLIAGINGSPVAALYGLRYGSSFYFYQSGFDPEFSRQSVGLVIMGLGIRTAIEEGAAEYDLLHGDEEYKFHWAPQTRELGRIEVFPPHSSGRIFRHAIRLNRSARQMARRVLRY